MNGIVRLSETAMAGRQLDPPLDREYFDLQHLGDWLVDERFNLVELNRLSARIDQRIFDIRSLNAEVFEQSEFPTPLFSDTTERVVLTRDDIEE